MALLPTVEFDGGDSGSRGGGGSGGGGGGGGSERRGRQKKEPGWPDLVLKSLIELTEGEFLYGGGVDGHDATDPGIVVRRAADSSYARNMRALAKEGPRTPVS